MAAANAFTLLAFFLAIRDTMASGVTPGAVQG
jgi:hypothetical protein